MGFRTSTLWFPAIPLSCHPNYRALTFTLAGLSPAEHTSLSWLQPPHQLISRRGTTRPKVPHARCEGAGSKGDGTILYRGIFQPCRDPVTHPPWIHKLLLSVFDLRSSPFEDGTSRHHASFKITPKRHQQLARQRHNGDAADAAFRGTDTRPEPDAQIAVGLIAQPQPGEFDPGGSPVC